MTGVETAVFSLEDLADDQFALADAAQMKTRFVRTTDAILEQAD